MNQFVIDMPNNRSGLRTVYSAAGDRRLPEDRVVTPVRPAWPFLVNSNAQGNKQLLQQESANPSGFAS
jgi:hypothetical protein